MKLSNCKLNPGEVALIGAGPGDPDLLTIRAYHLIQQADVAVYDRLINPLLLEFLPEQCERLYVGKQCGNHFLSQEKINQLLIDKALEGKKVIRLKGGDSFIFGRGGEEVQSLLEKGIHCQVVPGVTAASGCTSYAGIPLTHRDYAQSCTFITGHQKSDGDLELSWPSLAAANQTLVFYMGLKTLPIISRELIKHGLDENTPAALISKGTQSEQRTVRGLLADLPGLALRHELKSPTLIVVGKVVNVFKDYQVEFPAKIMANAEFMPELETLSTLETELEMVGA